MHSPRSRDRLRLVAVMQQNFLPPRLDPLDPGVGELDSRRLALLLQLLEQRLFHVRRELEPAFQLQIRWVGVDRLRLGKVRDRRERLRRLEDPEVQRGPFRLDRRRHTRHAATDDREIEHFISCSRGR